MLHIYVFIKMQLTNIDGMLMLVMSCGLHLYFYIIPSSFVPLHGHSSHSEYISIPLNYNVKLCQKPEANVKI